MRNQRSQFTLPLLISAGTILFALGVSHTAGVKFTVRQTRTTSDARRATPDESTKSGIELLPIETNEDGHLGVGIPQPNKTAELAFREFDGWADAFNSELRPEIRKTMLARGESIAKSRRAALKHLIETDPKRAIALAVPHALRLSLPGAIRRQLEERISEWGDLGVTVTCSFDQKLHSHEVSRRVTVADQAYAAFVYGKRQHQVSQKKTWVEGIAIDQSLALADIAERSPPSGNNGLPRLPLAGDVGGGSGYSPQLPTANSSYTQGTKRLLFMRVSFPDDTSEPMSESAAVELMNRVNQVYVGYSYNTTSIISDVTPLLLLPKTKSAYSGQSPQALQTDARAAALAAGYATANYDFDIVRNNQIPGPNFAFAGQADVGGKGMVLQNSLLYVVVHELGHNYGLWHANFWNASGDSIIGPGSTSEYGNTFDTMGSQTPDAGSFEFNAQFKYQLQWLPSSFVQTVTSSGIHRIFAYDVPNLLGGQKFALRVRKDYSREYWAEYRQKLVGNPWTQNGILLNWSPFGNSTGDSLGGTTLLDTTPGTASSSGSREDAPVVIGRTFSDAAAGIHITPLAKGSNGSDKWIDVQVNLGAFSGNIFPTLNLSANQTTVATNVPVGFTATGSDGNGDSLAYYWDFGDLTFGTNDSTATKSWSTAGEYVVRCIVSDMKGGVSSRSIAITVGSPGTSRLSGRVTVNGQPLEGVRIHNGLTGALYRGGYSDEDGNYTLTNLASGSFTLFALKDGYTVTASGFSNPVTVGSGLTDQHWTATQGPVLGISAADASASEIGPDPGTFTVARSGSLASPITMKFSLSGGATYLTDYTLVPTPAMSSSYQLTIPANVASMNIVLTPLINAIAEGPETVTLTIVEDPAYTLGAYSEATVTISDGQAAGMPAISVSALDDSAPESGNDSGIFRFTRSNVGTGNLTIYYSVAGSATSGVDYSALSGVATISGGQTSVDVAFNSIDDANVEGNETVTVTTSANATYTMSTPASATVKIVDDDPVAVTIAATGNVATEQGDPGTFTVTRTGSLSANLVVNYTMGGSATQGLDYTALSGSITIVAGQSTASFNLTTINDSLAEGTETAVAILSSSPVYNIGNSGAATVTINDDDGAGITLTVPDGSASEAGANPGTFRFTRTGSTAGPLTVNFLIGGTAFLGGDYATSNTSGSGYTNSIIIPADSLSVDLTVTPVDDAIKEGNETVTVTLQNPVNSSYSVITTSPQIVTIADNDSGGLVGVSWASSASSGRESQVSFPTFTVQLSAAASVFVSVNYAINNGTASSPSDYVYDPPSTVVFSPGEVSKTLELIYVLDDTTAESNETILFTLSPASNCVLDASNTIHTFTILDDDGGSGTVTVTATDSSASETGPNTGTFRISRSGATAGSQTVNFQTTGTASSPSDYLPVANSAVIPAGQNHVDIVITPVNDNTPEPTETVVLTLTSASGATIGSTNSATVFIADNDDSSALPIVSIIATDSSASEAGPEPGTFTVTRAGNATPALTVNYTVSGTATNGSDYAGISNSITIPSGSSDATITIAPISDAINELDETVVITLTVDGTYRAAPAASAATVTIGEGPPPVIAGFATSATTTSENVSPAMVLVSLGAAKATPVTVHYAATGGTATGGGVDYSLAPGTLTFAPGETLKTIPIAIIKDGIPEVNETVVITLDSPVGATLGTSSFTLSIVDGSVVVWDANTGSAGAQDGAGVWDTANTKWLRNGANTPFVNGDTVAFGAGSGAAGTVTITGLNLLANGIVFNPTGSGAYVVAPSATETLGILNDGIVANESATLSLRPDLGASQAWTVVAGKTLSVGTATQFMGGLDPGETLVISGTGTVQSNGAKVLVNSGTSSTIQIETGATLEMNKGTTNNSLFARNATDTADATINIAGTGTLRFKAVGANTYFAGGVFHSAFTGTIECAGDGRLGAQAGTKYRLHVSSGVNADLSSNVGSTVSIDGLTGAGTLLQNNPVAGTVALAFGVNDTTSGGMAGAAQWDGAFSTTGANRIDITKVGTGTEVLNGFDDRASGGSTTLVSAGTLLVTNAAAISGEEVAGRITVQSGGTLTLRGGSAGEWTTDSLGILVANAVFDVGSRLGIDVSAGNSFAHTAPISGSQSLLKLGSGTLTLTEANTYTGDTIVAAGTLRLGAAGLANPADVSVTTGAVLDLSFIGTDTIDELRFNGVPQVQGTWGSLASSAQQKIAFITGTGILNVTGGPLPPFAAWAVANGLDNSPGKESGFDADPDKDGIANGLEWILGGNPLADSVSRTPQVGGDQTNVTLTFARADDSESSTTLLAQWSGSLGNWNDFLIGASSSGPDANGVSVSVSENQAAPDTVVVTVPRTNGASGAVFIRLKATRP